MRTIINTLLGIFIITAALANGSTEPPYNAASAKSHVVKKRYYRPQPSLITVTLYPGSLKSNIIEIAHQCGWDTVVWNVPEDYMWVGKTQISGTDLPSIFIKIFSNYPLQAQFYEGNRVLAIVPRNLP